MDGEVSTLIADIQSLLAQIEQVSGNGGGEVEEGAVKMQKAEMPDAGAGEPDADDAGTKLEAIKKILKAMAGEDEGSEEDKKEDKVEKSDEGPNASDDAEERIDDGQGEVNEKNVNEVAKALVKMLGVKTVAKSKPKQSGDIDRVLKALEKIADRVGEQEKAIIGIYEGLGVADEIKKSAKVETVEKSRPRNDPNEIKKSAEYIREMLGLETPNKDKSVEGRFSLKKALLENDGLALTAMMSTKQK